MPEKTYSQFKENELILRDELAIDRTLLANERTLLAYLRSGVALTIAGVSIMNFAEQSWFWAVGLTCLPFGFITAAVGIFRHRKMSNAISLVRKSRRKPADKKI